ncbi:winged helix-turn-helix domain-containing protein [Deinococcus detaillensis]|uniref:winged helix-turn-helix domain-containing protein n=1 Tax=Deinococcus detaillensis TaxID=2592048 RepID=UPI00163D7AB4|nr:winged helix-turn-helix domain-containing protein [Deinococcus detaillensis]
MIQIQLGSLQITDLAAARALRQDSKFLAHFIVPLSPSDVAPRLGMAANLAHHHARKLVDVGLLFEQSREGGKVLYQLAAREFRVSSNLLPPEDEAGNGSATMRGLSAGFLQAYERSWRNMNEGQEDVYGFGTTEWPAHLDQLPYPVSDEPYPTHSDTLRHTHPAPDAGALSTTGPRPQRLTRRSPGRGRARGGCSLYASGAGLPSRAVSARAAQPQPRQLFGVAPGESSAVLMCHDAEGLYTSNSS